MAKKSQSLFIIIAWSTWEAASIIMPKISLILLALFMCGANSETPTLHCRQCSTVTDPECAEPYNIEEAPETPCPTDKMYTVCRKIEQTVNGKSDVFRKCGWIESDRDCYQTRDDEFSSYVCQCRENMCNSNWWESNLVQKMST